MTDIDARGPTRTALRRVLPGEPWAAVRAAWHQHRDLLSNAGSLVMSTGVASLLGVIYWAVATRLFSQRAVGYASAAVSAMTLLGTIGMLGLGTLLIGELPRRRDRAGLVAAALLTCGLAALLLGGGFAVVAPRVSVNFAIMIGTPARGLLFAAGVAVTAVTLVFDQATIGLMRGSSCTTSSASASPCPGWRGWRCRWRWSRSGYGSAASRSSPGRTGACCAVSAAARWPITG